MLLAIGASNVTRVKRAWEVDLGGRGVAVAVSRSGSRVAAATQGSSARVYDFYGGRSTGVSASCASILRGGLALHGRRLVVVCQNALELYDARSLKQLDAPELASARATAAHVAWPWLAVGHHDGVLRLYHLENKSQKEISVPGPPVDVKSLALTADGKHLAVAWVQGSIWWWDVSAPDEPHKLVRHERESDSLCWSGDGKLLAEEGAPGKTTLWSFEAEPKQHQQLDHVRWLKRLLFTPDQELLVRAGAQGLELAEVDGDRRTQLDDRGMVEDASLDETGAALAAVDRDGRLTLWLAR